MASIHRKLFPASTTTNQTQDCPDFCDPACPYNCYPFPDYYYPPPPPSSDDSTTGSHISFFLIILASLCIVIFILYVIKVKCYATWCGWRNNGQASFRSDVSSEEFLDDDQLDHHVWLITTVGLNQSIINSITVCKYKKGEGLIDGTECSVCLNEFQEDETLRLLPKCNHAFHIPCIDTWLRSHTNCPLCRAGIVSLSNNVSAETGMPTLASIQENGNISGRSQEIQIENFQNEVELRNNDNMLRIASVEMLENRAETREGQELNNESNCKQSGVANNRSEVVQEDSGIDEAQKVMRSVSMDYRLGCSNSDSWGSANSCSNLVEKDGEYTSMLKTMRGSSIAQCLHLRPISMKRSFSCSGRIVYRGNRI